MDGTWETATIAFNVHSLAPDAWRREISTVSFSEPKKVLRIGLKNISSNAYDCVNLIHLYGQKYGERHQIISYFAIPMALSWPP